MHIYTHMVLDLHGRNAVPAQAGSRLVGGLALARRRSITFSNEPPRAADAPALAQRGGPVSLSDKPGNGAAGGPQHRSLASRPSSLLDVGLKSKSSGSLEGLLASSGLRGSLQAGTVQQLRTCSSLVQPLPSGNEGGGGPSRGIKHERVSLPSLASSTGSHAPSSLRPKGGCSRSVGCAAVGCSSFQKQSLGSVPSSCGRRSINSSALVDKRLVYACVCVHVCVCLIMKRVSLLSRLLTHTHTHTHTHTRMGHLPATCSPGAAAALKAAPLSEMPQRTLILESSTCRSALLHAQQKPPAAGALAGSDMDCMPQVGRGLVGDGWRQCLGDAVPMRA